MKLLLDTRALLWWLADDPRLGEAARAALASPDQVVYLSAATWWELVLKQGAGKLRLPPEFGAAVAEAGFVPLPITAAHALAVAELPPVHRDPFDRMLLAQARVEGLTLVTADAVLADYPVDILDASTSR